MKTQYKVAKVWSDGHIWTDTFPDMERLKEAVGELNEDPSLVCILISKNVLRS